MPRDLPSSVGCELKRGPRRPQTTFRDSEQDTETLPSYFMSRVSQVSPRVPCPPASAVETHCSSRSRALSSYDLVLGQGCQCAVRVSVPRPSINPGRSVPASAVVSSISVRLGPRSVPRLDGFITLRLLGHWKPDQIMALACSSFFVPVPALPFAMLLPWQRCYILWLPTSPSLFDVWTCLRLVLRSFFY